MELLNANDVLTVKFKSEEFWFLAKIMGPGILYGIENPTDKLTDKEQAKNNDIALDSLKKAGVLKINDENQIILDKVLGALFYCCLQADHVLIIKDISSNKSSLVYFKPQWQVELLQVEDYYIMNAIKDRNKLFDYIVDKYAIELQSSNNNDSFMIKENDLEFANSFYQNGEIEKALGILNKNRFPPSLRGDHFLEAFIKPEVWIKFQMIYDLNDKKNCRSRYFELFQFSEGLYWVSHLIAFNETYALLTYQAVTPEEAHFSFIDILP